MRTIKTLLATAAGGLALAGCGAETSETQNTAISDEIAHVVEAVETVENAVVEDDNFDDLFAAESKEIKAEIAAIEAEIAADKAEIAAIDERIAADKAEIAADKAEIAATKERIAASLKRSAELLKGKTK